MSRPTKNKKTNNKYYIYYLLIIIDFLIDYALLFLFVRLVLLYITGCPLCVCTNVTANLSQNSNARDFTFQNRPSV